MSDPQLNQTATIVEWKREKGYGFLEVRGQRVFLHVSDFVERHKAPAVGDKIRFEFGQDAKGRTRARNAVHLNDGGRLTLISVTVLAGLLVLPTMALLRYGTSFRWVFIWLGVISAFTYWMYSNDKRYAREKDRRVPERDLHIMAMLGGWPGAYLAQRRLRHKCAKPVFQFVFWLIVLVYQFAAFDSMRNWKTSKEIWFSLEQMSNQRPLRNR